MFTIYEYKCYNETCTCIKQLYFESDYTGAKFYYQTPFISSSELCSRISSADSQK